MGRRRRELAALRDLNRSVWGERAYRRHFEPRTTQRRHRRRDTAAIAVGLPLIAFAAVLMFLPTDAYAHTSAIDIACTGVTFHYQGFADTTTTAHEIITIDGTASQGRVFTFSGGQASDTVALTFGAGTHTIDASDSWSSSDGGGSAQTRQTLSNCTPTSTSTSTSTSIATSTSRPTSTTAATTPTTSAPTTTVPRTTVPASSTTLVVTTTVPASTTSAPRTSTTGSPVTEAGSTVPTSTVPTSTSVSPSTGPISKSSIPFTGSSNRPPAIAIALLGFGLVAMGAGGRRRPTVEH